MPYLIGGRTVYRIGECRKYFNVRTLRGNEYQDFTTLKDQCRWVGQPFVDPEFDPDDDSLDLIGQIDLRNQGSDYPAWNGGFVWKRPRDAARGNFKQTGATCNLVFDNPTTGCRFSKNDIIQGGLGDCWYLTSLSSITDQIDLVEFVIPADNKTEPELGIYHFRFWHKGIYVDVVVDDRLPYWDPLNTGQFEQAFTQITGNEIWPALIEKAYAKLHKNYAGIEGGVISNGLEDFTGGLAVTIELKSDPVNIHQRVTNNYNSGNFIGFSTVGDTEDDENSYVVHEGPDYLKNYGLVSGHAYSMVGLGSVSYQGQDVTIVKLRNPWGNKSLEWNGDWSDTSPLWNELTACERSSYFENKPDGQFWLSFDDATNLKFFGMIDICHWINDLDHSIDLDTLPIEYKKYDGSWNGALAAGTENIFQNPQYQLKLKRGWTHSIIEAGCMLLVSLLRKDYAEKKNDVPGFGFHVFKLKDPNLSSLPFTETQLTEVYHHDGFMGGGTMREMTRIFYYEEGSYVVIPYAEKAGDEGDFLLRIMSEGNFHTAPAAVSVGKPFELQFSDTISAKSASVKCTAPAPANSGAAILGEVSTVKITYAPLSPVQKDSEEERFLSLAGENCNLNRKELTRLLNLTYGGLPNFNGFGNETARGLMATVDYDSNGQLDYLECCQLLKKLQTWIANFTQFDGSKNGFLNFHEYWSLLNYQKTPLDLNAIQKLYAHLANSDEGIDLDNFVFAAAKVDAASRVFTENKLDSTNTVNMNKGSWIKSTIFY